MAEDRFNGLFESLEATFDAAAARAEREAADDLAIALRQDRSAPAVLSRDGWSVWNPSATTLPIVGVGSDYVLTASDDLIPLRTLVATRTAGAPPVSLPDSLRERLRLWAREATDVQLEAGNESFTGRLVLAGRDHVVVRNRRIEILVGLERVERVSRRLGSSADAS